jgi:hypothetical protein
MNLDQTTQPKERVGIKKRISNVWNSRNRMVRLIMLVTTGLVLNCCCVIIPLASKANSLPAQSNVGVNASSPATSTAVQDPLMPSASAISAHTVIDHNGDGRAACKNFNSAVQVSTAYIQLEGSDKAGRSCK